MKLHRFRGGVEVADQKSLSADIPLQTLPLPPELVVSLKQHAGVTATPVVAVGDTVLRGQLIGQATPGGLSANVHAPTSGEVIAIEHTPLLHVSGLSEQAVTIRPDGKDQTCDTPPVDTNDPHAILAAIHDAGIVGLGGAGFPGDVKALTGMRKKITTLIINGVECEPYITCDDRLMRDFSEEVAGGIAILSQLLSPERIILGVEDNKADAIKQMSMQLDSTVEVAALPTRYPSGGERQLTKLLLDIDLDSKHPTFEAGVLCFNVATCHAIYQAVTHARPLTERIMTVTGDDISTRGNFWVRFGTPIGFILQQLGISTDCRVRIGGPFMGFVAPNHQAGVTKTTNCLLIEKPVEYPTEVSCIRCMRCAEVCPSDLLPHELHLFAKSGEYDKTVEYNLFDCIECGCCSYVCPSYIPLVQSYQHAKAHIRAESIKKARADQARIRHDRRQERTERLARERQEKMQRQREALKAKKAKADADADKAATIKAAIERTQST
jgi:Na+-translocating ferredoxin:NAD+ oxidoreductase subunit C